jgi:hypothetical protein
LKSNSRETWQSNDDVCEKLCLFSNILHDNNSQKPEISVLCP